MPKEELRLTQAEDISEARQLLSKALHERAPATAEAIGDESIVLSSAEMSAVSSLATLLHLIDWGNGPETR